MATRAVSSAVFNQPIDVVWKHIREFGTGLWDEKLFKLQIYKKENEIQIFCGLFNIVNNMMGL